MAVRTISNSGGLWSLPTTWVEGAVPLASDDVVATATSGNVTIDIASVCRSIDLTNYVNTLTHNSGVILSIGDAIAGAGNIALKFVVGMNYVLGDVTTSSINFISTSAVVQTIDFGGKNSGDVVYNATSNGSWQLVSSHITDYGAKVTLIKGTLDINGQTCIWGAFNSDNANVRSLILGSASIFLNGGGSIGNTFWITSIVTNLTIPANTASVTITKFLNSNAPLFFTGTFNFNGMSLYFIGGGIMTVRGTGTFYNLGFTGDIAPAEDRFQVNTNVVVTNQLILNGYSASRRLRVHSNSFGSVRTITITGATVVASNVNFNWITLSVLTDLSLISGGAGDMGGNSGIIFTPSITNYWYSSSSGQKLWNNDSNWFFATGGTGGNSRVPLPQDDARFDSNSFPVTDVIVRTDYPILGTNIDWTGSINNPQWHVTDDLTLNAVTILGSVTLVSGMRLSNSPTTSIFFRGQTLATTFTLTNAGHSWNVSLFLIQINSTSTMSLQDDYVGTGLLQITGIFDSNNNNITTDRFTQSSGTLNMGSGIWKLNGTGTVWSASGTVNSDTSTIKISNNSQTQKTFAGGSKIYYNLLIEGLGICFYNFTGSNTFNDFSSSKTVAYWLLFTAGTTTTVTTFNVNGSAGNLVTLSSTTTANHTLTKSGGGTITCDYMLISRSTATPALTWYATNSIDGGSNSGWNGLTIDPFTWTGATNQNWNVGSNWYGGVSAGVNDIAYFTGLYNADCISNPPTNVKGINISAYTGTFTQGNLLNIGTSGFIQAGGTVIESTAKAITNAGSLIQTLGTYTPDTGSYTFVGSLDCSVFVLGVYGSGDVIVDKGSGLLKMLKTFTLSNNLNINSGIGCTNGFNVIISGNLTVLPSGSLVRIVGSTVTVLGTTIGVIKSSYVCQNKGAFFLGVN